MNKISKEQAAKYKLGQLVKCNDNLAQVINITPLEIYLSNGDVIWIGDEPLDMYNCDNDMEDK